METPYVLDVSAKAFVVMRILFICEGNIGRSQMAEALLRTRSGDAHEIRSAGTRVGEKEGTTLNDTSSAGPVLEVMRELEIDMGTQTRTHISPELVDWADRMYLLTDPVSAPDYVMQSPKLLTWEIQDPYMMTIEETARIRDRIRELIDEKF